MPEESVRTTRRAARRRAREQLDDVAEWARTAEGPLTVAEAEARLVRRDRHLTSTVLDTRRHGETETPFLHPRLRAGLKPLRWALWAALIALPSLPLLLIPRHTGSSSPAVLDHRTGRFLEALEVTSLLVIAVQLVLLLAWAVWPARAHVVRLISAVAVLLVFPLVLFSGLFLAIRGGTGDWGSPASLNIAAAALAIGNLLAVTSLRSLEHAHARDLQRIQHALTEDTEWRQQHSGPRGPVAALGWAVALLEEREQNALRRNGDRVLRALEDRGEIAPETTRAAAEMPLGRWHELDL
ncbi:hypothetical protein ACT3SY_07430 [Brachybacterium sp. AOP42-E1-35]|uniref:hypothetical protein n=2 Tax=Brachybacterium TaxID=43668 RepID=UPI003F9143B4